MPKLKRPRLLNHGTITQVYYRLRPKKKLSNQRTQEQILVCLCLVFETGILYVAWLSWKSLGVFGSWRHDITCIGLELTSHARSSPRACETSAKQCGHIPPCQQLPWYSPRLYMPGTVVAPPMTKMVARLCAAKQGRAENLRSMASLGVPDSITTATKMKKTRRFRSR